MKKNIVIDLVNNKTTADSLMLYDAVRLEVITGIKGLFSVREDKIPKLIIAWHRFPLLEEPNNWMISEDGSSATLEFVLKSFGIKDSFVHIPAKGFRLFEFNIIIPKNNVAVASVRINVQNNTLEGIPFSQQDRDKLDSIDLTNYYTKVEVDNKFASFDPGTGGAVYAFTKPLNVDTNNVVSIDLTEYAKLTDLPKIPNNLSSFTNDTGFITKSALNGYATEYFVTSRGYITAADIPDIPVIPTNISAFNNDKGYITANALNGYATETFVTSQGYAKVSDIPTIPTKISSFTNDAGYITIKDVPSVDLTPYALKSNTLAGYGITDANISGRTITLGGNSIDVPESSGGSGDYTLTKEAVDGVVGASTTGSATKFYNEQGAFTEVDMSGYLPLSGGTITGDLSITGSSVNINLNDGANESSGSFSVYVPVGLDEDFGTPLYHSIQMPVSLAYATFTSTNGWKFEVIDSATNDSMSFIRNYYNRIRIYNKNIVVLNAGEDSEIMVSLQPADRYKRVAIKAPNGAVINDIPIATVNDISTHNTDTTSHADLFALKVDTETYNTAITAINNALDGKENTGVAQGLVDAHNESATAHEVLFGAKADKTELDAYLPLSGGTMTGQIEFGTTNIDIRPTTSTDGYTCLRSSPTSDDGAYIALIGKDAASPGCFCLYATDGANKVLLSGKPDGTLTWGGQSVLNPTGTVIAFAGNSAPAGYLICNGAAVNRTTYAKLFAVIGTTYGEGDGSTTFNLPNLTNKFIMGSSTAGTSKNAGLPNIDGDFVLRRGGSSGTTSLRMASSGAFSADTTNTTTSAIIWNATSYSSAVVGTNFTFKSSRSSSIYKDSVTTVQPPALTMRFYIKY